MTPRLTIVLPLRGRHLFTLRFLWHLDREKFPFRILIADGMVHPKLACILENSRQQFSNLDIEYVRYPDDANYSCFYAKMADALGRVRTPYAMLADNDDFLVTSGIKRSLDFLDAHADYVCCGGGLAGFSVYAGLNDENDGLLGRANRYAYRYTPHDRSVDFGSAAAAERLRSGSRNWWTYYAVFRTQALQTICREIVEIDFTDLQLHEFYCAMRTLTLGKAFSDATTIAYLRQYATARHSNFKRDWVHHLLRSRFSSEFKEMIDRISSAAAAADGADREEVAGMLRDICETWLREFLRTYFGSSQTVKQLLRDQAPALVHWLKKRRRYGVGWERARLFSRLAGDGASADYVAKFRGELAAIEDVLAGNAFASYASRCQRAFGSSATR